jgi:hypothetical protein
MLGKIKCLAGNQVFESSLGAVHEFRSHEIDSGAHLISLYFAQEYRYLANGGKRNGALHQDVTGKSIFIPS